MSDGSASLHDDVDSSDGLDNTPREEVRDGPLPEGHPGFRPAGPPPPRPVCGPDPNDDQPRREEDGVANYDNRSAAAPARHTPARRPPPPDSSSSSSSDTDDADPDPETAEEEHAHDDDGWWSDTSIILEGAELDEARDYFVNQFRRQLRESQPDLSNRSVAGQVGALRRRLAQSSWLEIQGLATQRLLGAFLREWTDFEYRATHQYHPGRAMAAVP